MPRKLAGISYSHTLQLLLLVIQLCCYVNQYYVVVFMLGPIPFWAILLITFFNFQALTALYSANSIHQKTFPNSQNSQYCRRCKEWISNRDHHCVFTGRCVQKSNYPYFISYVLYSYILSTILVATIANHYPLLLNINLLETIFAISLVGGLISGLYFMIFTAGLLSGSFRSIVLGIYTVEQIKKVKIPEISNSQLRRMWFSSNGRSQLLNSFRKHWKTMVGDNISFWQIILVW